MSRRAYPSRTLAAAVRTHFGLTQAELAAFIGVSRSHLPMHEAGTKTLGPAPDQRLQVLARQLPPPDGLGLPAPAVGSNPAPAAPLDPAGYDPTTADPAGYDLAALRRRLARCRWLHTRLAHEVEQQRQPSQARHQRRARAVRVLGPALAAPLPPPDWLAPGGPVLPLPPTPWPLPMPPAIPTG